MDLSLQLTALKKTLLFRSLSEPQLEPLARCCRWLHLQPNDLLFSAGEASQALFVVVRGRTRAFRHGADGREQIMHEDGPGATFPEVAVFDDGPYPSSVVAVEESHLLMIPKGEVRKFCLSQPEAALAALEVLSRRLRRATGMVEDLALREVGQRVAEYLLLEARNSESTQNEKAVVQLRHSNQELADLVGSVREVVSRAFSRLQKEKWIRKTGRRVEILDPEALEAYVEGL